MNEIKHQVMHFKNIVNVEVTIETSYQISINQSRTQALRPKFRIIDDCFQTNYDRKCKMTLVLDNLNEK